MQPLSWTTVRNWAGTNYTVRLMMHSTRFRQMVNYCLKRCSLLDCKDSQTKLLHVRRETRKSSVMTHTHGLRCIINLASVQLHGYTSPSHPKPIPERSRSCRVAQRNPPSFTSCCCCYCWFRCWWWATPSIIKICKINFHQYSGLPVSRSLVTKIASCHQQQTTTRGIVKALLPRHWQVAWISTKPAPAKN